MTGLGCAAVWFLSSKAFVNIAPRREVKTTRLALFDQEGFVYNFAANRDQTFWNDVGYFPDGTSFPKAGNAIFRPDTADLHTNGSPLPTSKYLNDVGYFPDGTAMNRAGNAIFRPDTVDPHQDGSPLPPSKYVNDIGYFPDGTPIDKAGNAIFRQ